MVSMRCRRVVREPESRQGLWLIWRLRPELPAGSRAQHKACHLDARELGGHPDFIEGKALWASTVSGDEPFFPASAGLYQAPWGARVPSMQVLAVADLLARKTVECPRENVTFKNAPKARCEPEKPGSLPF